MPRSPRRRIRFATVAPRIDGDAEPGWAEVASKGLGISNGCQDHTVLPSAATSTISPTGHVLPTEFLAKALKRRSSTRRSIAHGKTALRSRHAPDAAASTASHPASVTIAIRPSVGRTAAFVGLIWGRGEEEYFPQTGLTTERLNGGARAREWLLGWS
jgi:hypothetical protein